MNKIVALLGSTALATTLVAGSALAADPIKLSVGGFGAVMVGYASQDDAYIRSQNREVSAVDVKGDNELHFSGQTTLDNGLTVAVMYEFESGGRDNTAYNDEWSISVSGSFGTIKTGADDNALAMIHNNAPRVGGRLFNGGTIGNDVMAGAYVLKPDGFDDALLSDTILDTNGDAESISYISPAFAGFTFGATYVPSVNNNENVPTQPRDANSVVSDAYGAGLAYKGAIGAVSVGADIGWLTADPANTVDSHHEYSAGLNLGYAGFIVGGAFRQVDRDAPGTAPDLDARIWEVGVSYETGPYGVSLNYVQGSQDVARSQDDKVTYVELAGEYKMGPGVSLVGGLSHVKFDQQGTAASGADNDGWVLASGLSLTF